MDGDTRMYPVETNDSNVGRVFLYWNGKHMWLPTKWLVEKRIPSKLRNKPCDKYVALMIAQKIGTWWPDESQVPQTLIDFVRACQSGNMDISQLYTGDCVHCHHTITNLAPH
jgi:hypothetical protein